MRVWLDAAGSVCLGPLGDGAQDLGAALALRGLGSGDEELVVGKLLR
jgi:hypothetical protein